MIDSLTDYVASLSPFWFYVAVAVSAYVENVFPPVPGDTVTVFAAYVVGRSQRHFVGVLISTTAGSTAGFMTLYALGRLIRPEYFLGGKFRFLSAGSFHKAGAWFHRYGYRVVLFNRFFSGIRSVISVVCGVYRMPWAQALLLSALGCTLWNGLLIWAGYQLGANWGMVETALRHYSWFFMGASAVIVLVWLARRYSRSVRGAPQP